MSAELGKNTVERTLVIPLWCRAMAAGKLPEILPDRYAGRILRRLGEKHPPHPLYHMQCAALTGAIRQYDLAAEVTDYLTAHPGAAVVEMGAGLSPLRRQMKNENNPWINLDLPDVIALRNRFLPASAPEQNIACDVTDHAWFDEIPFDEDSGVIFLAAGLLHYFDRETVRSLLCAMAERFPGGVLVFDITTEKGFRNGKMTVRTSGNATQLKFAVTDAAAELGAWSPRLKNIRQRDYYTGYNPPTGNFTPFTKLYVRSKQGQLAVVHVEFAGK